MAKRSKALSGAAKDAYIRRVLAGEAGLDDDARARLTARLQGDIALVSLKVSRPPPRPRTVIVATEDTPTREAVSTAGSEVTIEPAGTLRDGRAAETPDTFDPYSPNVIVVIRTRGRDAVLEALDSIEDAASLRLLAREQQLGIASDLDSAADIRLAIVAAAERRIANRRAAAS